ncbi:MAG: family 78 glycoside hydrolase catalytic domain [Clostridia bacterium]|nr:family 78 glycoside hydrolase catalytic domain [Clostridia bacterium]
MFGEKTKWIWINKENNINEYAEFKAYFSFEKNKTALFRISCDGIYSVRLNGRIVAFSACADYPDYKFYDEFDISKDLKEENELIISVWHIGENSFTYVKDLAGVIFEVEIDGKIVSYSNKDVYSRKMEEYDSGYLKKITYQIGYGFSYDADKETRLYSPSTEVEKTRDLHKRNIKGLVLGDRLPIKTIKKEKSLIIDMGKEVAGFFELDFYSADRQKILIAYGEHLKDGNVRRIIGVRDFSVEYVAKQGRNVYLNPFRRIAGRYIEIFSESPIDIDYVGIRPVNYPIKTVEKKFKDPLCQKIYDVSVETLRLCMHEHYEDCPWREQALYNMDSRNQMLCGYYAFKGGNFDYVRHNLLLISKGIRSDGLLSICFPSGLDVPIPFFSLMYIVQVCEYVEYSKDETIIGEVGDVIKSVFNVFRGRVEENGLIKSFAYPYWNFYEWTEESANDWQIERKADDESEESYDLILNCAYVYAAKYYEKLFGERVDTDKTKRAIKETFYNNGSFRLSTKTHRSSQLGTAFAILIGLGGEELAETIIKDNKMIKATLSMKAFVYDALLTFGRKYENYILKDIKITYEKMLDAGATSFWETEKGSEDFDGAGSLCHGWSAIPVYYFNVLGVDKENT